MTNSSEVIDLYGLSKTAKTPSSCRGSSSYDSAVFLLRLGKIPNEANRFAFLNARARRKKDEREEREKEEAAEFEICLEPREGLGP